jgi:hypothetical protein
VVDFVAVRALKKSASANGALPFGADIETNACSGGRFEE